MTHKVDVEVDATGLECPMPLLLAKRALNELQAGQQLLVLSTDAGSLRDFAVFVRQAGHQMLQAENIEGIFTFVIRKRDGLG